MLCVCTRSHEYSYLLDLRCVCAYVCVCVCVCVCHMSQVWAIDNDQVYSVAWRPCGFDSMVLPTTQKFMINHLGFFYVLKYPQKVG